MHASSHCFCNCREQRHLQFNLQAGFKKMLCTGMVLGVNKGWGKFCFQFAYRWWVHGCLLQHTSSSLRNAVGYIIKCTAQAWTSSHVFKSLFCVTSKSFFSDTIFIALFFFFLCKANVSHSRISHYCETTKKAFLCPFFTTVDFHLKHGISLAGIC